MTEELGIHESCVTHRQQVVAGKSEATLPCNQAVLGVSDITLIWEVLCPSWLSAVYGNTLVMSAAREGSMNVAGNVCWVSKGNTFWLLDRILAVF